MTFGTFIIFYCACGYPLITALVSISILNYCIVARASNQWDCRDEDKVTEQARDEMDVSVLIN